MHRVAILAYDGVVPFDLSVPIEVFGRARLGDGRPAYDVKVCAAMGEVAAGLINIRTPHGLDVAVQADTIVIPGSAGIDRPVPAVLINAITEARGRLVSICTGAFVLAASGLLDGRRATTHWAAATELARRYPAVDVDPDVLFVDEDPVLTSAGAAAGLDLCLHIVRRDHGATVAALTARASVMPLERTGGQAQFITHEPPAATGTSLQPLLAWLTDNLHTHLTLADIAEHASMSARSLSRNFRHQTGTHPAAMAQPATHPPGTAAAGADRPLGGAGRQVGRIHLPNRIPRMLPADRRRQPSRPPPRIPSTMTRSPAPTHWLP